MPTREDYAKRTYGNSKKCLFGFETVKKLRSARDNSIANPQRNRSSEFRKTDLFRFPFAKDIEVAFHRRSTKTNMNRRFQMKI